jgi:hypothetical protein|uniref:Uncharacterized protein n=1 Tax=viral metagenome TaxID=1070528 RepID=A0A6C0CL01_9ZZZZ
MQFTYSHTSYLPYVPQPAGAPSFGQQNVGPKLLVGPASQGVLIKNTGGNAIIPTGNGESSNTPVPSAMPQKFYPSAGDSMFSRARKAYVQDAGGGTLLQGNFDSSQHIQLKKINTIGKSVNPGGPYNNTSFQGLAKKADHYRNSALARVRGGGTVAPKKKGAIENKFKSGGGSRLSTAGNRQIFANGATNAN